DGSTYYHPTLAFTFNAPSGWTTQNGKSAIVAAEPNQRAVVQLTLEKANGLSPAQYFGDLQTKGKITGADGRDETIGGWPGWTGHTQTTTSRGAAVPLTAAAVRRGDELFRFLGQTTSPGDADDAAIGAAIRSLRPLTDPARTSVRPDRVRVVAVGHSGTFRDV